MSDLPFPPLILASSSSSVVSASGAQIILYNSQTSKIINSPQVENKLQQNGFIRHLAITNDGKIVASVGDDKNLKVWDVNDDELKLRSTRGLIKKASHISFANDNSIIVSDKVGDVYSYPLDPIPSDPSTSRPPMYSMVSDPTKNPDCTYLLGHVSVTTQHIITPDNKYIITADRDEHIRISRYPKAYVIERQLFGHDGFVSALHIPSSQSNILISGGGDPSIRIWDWTIGQLVNKVDIYSAILPHRKVRSYMRKNKWKGRTMKTEETNTAIQSRDQEEGEETFYSAPEGYVLPTGQGVCIKKIDSLQISGKTIILFFSEGASSIHSFILPSDPSSPTTVNTLPLPYPLLDFTALPNDNGKILLSLDTAWGVLKTNPGPGTDARQDVIQRDELSIEEKESFKDTLSILEVNEEGKFSFTPSNDISSIYSNLPKTDIKTLSNLNLYPLINLLPRWPGLEEDEGIDIPQINSNENGNIDISDDLISLAPTNLTTKTLGGTIKNYTIEELNSLNLKVLGRLKSNGVDVNEILKQRQKKSKEERKLKLLEINKKLKEEKEEIETQKEPEKKKQKQKQKQTKKVVILNEEDMSNS
ncbi:uncharacterized protein I206_105211 [Kwoniella pini CBS 10737]|uniref:Uncharacterized protein n=1 Tax=Kwoniella pini CBS 10737 TaxID=1296096 RepID=A0A1B9I4U6_9TREE|nr:uncharacterized protein I206_03880 [Kwoniella pini CBS 10737]OCF50555.1 hypothetical protein I206_03880 [Kwoniella pini CBS 10737]